MLLNPLSQLFKLASRVAVVKTPLAFLQKEMEMLGRNAVGSKIGVEGTVQGLKGKPHRGTFSFMWVLQCGRALNFKELRLD